MASTASPVPESGRQSGRSRRRILPAVALCLAQATIAGTGPADPRQRLGGASPAWLQAVGRLTVPSVRYQDGETRHYREDCSASLIAADPQRRADTVVTAWHCLENYRIVSRTIEFRLLRQGAVVFTSGAQRLADGGHIGRDWALLRLYKPVPTALARPLTLHTGPAVAGRPVTMAGFSRDSGLGDGGRRLTYHAGCRILAHSESLGETDCRAHKGASGGAVVQLSTGGRPQLLGVVSRGDGQDYSTYIPARRFRNAARGYLAPGL